MKTLIASLLATAALAGPAHAQTAVALVGSDTLAMVDLAARTVTGTAKVEGASLLGIDVRPADGMVYALSADGQIWTVDPASGKATAKSKLDMALPAGASITVDFNPVADRLRVIGSNGANLRINVDDGKVTKDGDLKFAGADMHKGVAPKVVAGAYTNSMKGAKETALLNVESATGALVKQAPPNDGVLGSVGMLGIKGETVAFDIAAGASGKNEGWLMSGDTLYRVDLATGNATALGKVTGVGSGPVRDIAVMPAM